MTVIKFNHKKGKMNAHFHNEGLDKEHTMEDIQKALLLL